jgi:hypothetical protein
MSKVTNEVQRFRLAPRKCTYEGSMETRLMLSICPAALLRLYYLKVKTRCSNLALTEAS